MEALALALIAWITITLAQHNAKIDALQDVNTTEQVVKDHTAILRKD